MTEMKKHIYDESNGLWYELIGDYYIPILVLPLRNSTPLVNGDGCTGTISEIIVRSCLIS